MKMMMIQKVPREGKRRALKRRVKMRKVMPEMNVVFMLISGGGG